MELNYRGWDVQMYRTSREAIQREVEKERIREEIVAARRRVLEAEVRREMAMETEMALMRCEIGRFPHPGDAKNKVNDLGKPNGVTMSGAKGKQTGSSEWSCAVCKVSAPCKQAFNAHLAGKKHEAQMADLKAKNAQKHATQQKKTSKKQSGEIGLGVKSSTTTTTMKTESSKSNKSVKTQPPPLMKKNSSKCNSKKEEVKKSEGKGTRQQFSFSCEMCDVEATSDKDMNTHIKGKKHLENLLKLHQVAAGPGTKKPQSRN